MRRWRIIGLAESRKWTANACDWLLRVDSTVSVDDSVPVNAPRGCP